MLALCFWSSAVQGQEKPTKTRDNSKPTNVYSQIDNFLEYVWSPDLETFGYNPRITYTPNADNLILAEIPLLYSTKTDRFGMGDIRLRYFGIPYRDYTRLLTGVLDDPDLLFVFWVGIKTQTGLEEGVVTPKGETVWAGMDNQSRRTTAPTDLQT